MTIELLQTDKMFIKLAKKQLKEAEVIRKRHLKEKCGSYKQLCAVADRMVLAHEKEKQLLEKQLDRGLKKNNG